MRIVLSAAMSVDGYIDDTTKNRLILSSPEDWKAVHALRAECDAILVGAGTLRTDNPALVIRDPALKAKRRKEGRNPDLIKVAISGSGQLDPSLKFFTEGKGEKLLFTSGIVSHEISDAATIISRPVITATVILTELRRRGINSLLIEGGTEVMSMFLRERSWDEFRLAIAPMFIGDPSAPRLVLDGEKLPPMKLSHIDQHGQTAVMNFVNNSQYRIDCIYINRAIELSRLSPVCDTCFRVGAVVVTKKGGVFEGYTHETGPTNHAEEEAIAKAKNAGADLRGATMYSTIEPCSYRKSRQKSCSELIIENGFSRVLFSAREPEIFTKCDGCKMLREAGIEVVEMTEFEWAPREINKHLDEKTPKS